MPPWPHNPPKLLSSTVFPAGSVFFAHGLPNRGDVQFSHTVNLFPCVLVPWSPGYIPPGSLVQKRPLVVHANEKADAQDLCTEFLQGIRNLDLLKEPRKKHTQKNKTFPQKGALTIGKIEHHLISKTRETVCLPVPPTFTCPKPLLRDPLTRQVASQPKLRAPMEAPRLGSGERGGEGDSDVRRKQVKKEVKQVIEKCKELSD